MLIEALQPDDALRVMYCGARPPSDVCVTPEGYSREHGWRFGGNGGVSGLVFGNEQDAGRALRVVKEAGMNTVRDVRDYIRTHGVRAFNRLVIESLAW